MSGLRLRNSSVMMAMLTMVLAGGNGCGGGAGTPSAADAKAFLTEVNATMLRLGVEQQQAGWVYSTFITPDTEALNFIMQSYLLEGIKKYMNDLPDLKGSAIILDDNSERIYPMRVRPRFTWHGGEAPSSVNVERKI